MHHYRFQKVHRILELKRASLQRLEDSIKKLEACIDSWIPLYSSNARIDPVLGDYVIALAEMARDHERDNAPLRFENFHYKEVILQRLARRDPLARKLWQAIATMSYVERDEVFEKSDLAERLLLRGISQIEYEFLCEGTLPFSELGDSQWFLSKTRKKFRREYKKW